MTNIRLFALVCWTLWIGLLPAGGRASAPLAAALAVSIFCLWRLFRREAVLRTARLR